MPEEISECGQLERVDISQNSFIALPNCLFTLTSLVTLDARKNFIAGKFKLKRHFGYLTYIALISETGSL